MREPIPSNLFFSKNDPNDIRLGDLFKALTNNQNEKKSELTINLPVGAVALVGYPDDEGIKLNGGRVGASLAPNKIREFLYKMTPHCLNNNSRQTKFYDLGNIRGSNLNLEERHELALKNAYSIYQAQAYTISLGGGHDYGFSDSSAFLDYYLKRSSNKPVVINFDAHLDVRPSSVHHSGTPFYRLLTKYKNQFDFVEIGLQPQCNSSVHWSWALEHGAELISNEQVKSVTAEALFNQSTTLKNLNEETPVFISFDIDVLSSVYAPGCSQSWASGLTWAEASKLLNLIYNKTQAKGLGIYEVSPPLDFDNQTAKAAALVIHQYIYQNILK